MNTGSPTYPPVPKTGTSLAKKARVPSADSADEKTTSLAAKYVSSKSDSVSSKDAVMIDFASARAVGGLVSASSAAILRADSSDRPRGAR